MVGLPVGEAEGDGDGYLVGAGEEGLYVGLWVDAADGLIVGEVDGTREDAEEGSKDGHNVG